MAQATDTPLIACVAGEASGDAIGAGVLKALQQLAPTVRAAGIGGPQMAGQGMDLWWPAERLAVFGYAQALARLPQLLRIRQRLQERALEAPCAAFVGIDAPDFNFGLEHRLRQRGMPTVHIVCPSIWAWRGERVHTIVQAADLVLCLFPFEPDLLRQAGIAAEYVGHPLADMIPLQPPREQARHQLSVGVQERLVAILPGSRASEVEHIAPTFLAAARLLARDDARLRFVLPVAPGRDAQIKRLLRAAGELPLHTLQGQAPTALAACDAAMIASGTATLEAALYKVPMVIAYRLGWLNWQLMKGKGYLPWVGLPNILCREFVVPERIQHAATPQQLAQDVRRWLDDADACRRLRERFIALHEQLRQGMSARAARAIWRLISARAG